MRFGRDSITAIWAGLLILLVSACAPDKQESKLQGRTVRVQVPMHSEKSGYSFEIVELSTLSDLTHLKGLAARFLIDPSTRSGQLTGRPPEIRYVRNPDGVVIAKDSLSLQLLTAYSHFERLKLWDEKVGAQGLLKYPRTVAVNALVKGEDGGIQTNNALYLGQYDALMIQPYSKDALPLMANAGVIGHEHFHAFFQKIVIEPLGEKFPRVGRIDPGQVLEMRKQYHAALLRGVNEGLADVWGWIYSGDNSFVGRTLPQEKNRSIEQVPDILYGKEKLWMAIQRGFDEKLLITLSYQHGTQLARSLRQFARIRQIENQLSQEEIRVQMGQSIVRALPALKKRFESLKDDEFLTLSHVVGVFESSLDELPQP